MDKRHIAHLTERAIRVPQSRQLFPTDAPPRQPAMGKTTLWQHEGYASREPVPVDTTEPRDA